jgi:hypothetical protein
MFSTHLVKSFLLVISVSCMAQAQLATGRHHDSRATSQYQHDIGSGDSEGWVDSGSGVNTSPYNPDPRNPRPGYPGRGDQNASTIWVQRNVMNERFDLRALSGLGSNYNGFEVTSVRANVRPNSSGRTIVQLVADGRIIATQTNPGYQINLIPQMRLVLGSTVRTLQMIVNGSTYIENILIDVQGSQNYPQPPPPHFPPHEPPPYPGNPGQPGYPGHGQQQRLELNVYRNLVGNDRVDLGQYVSLSQYRGYAVEQIIINGAPQFNTSVMSAIINGNNMGQVEFSGSYSQSQTIWLSRRPVIGNGADSIVLYSTGNMSVQRVTLILSY